LFKNFKEKKMKKLIVAVAALAMLSTSAYAADWNFYGSARVSTFINDTDKPVGTTDTKNYEQGLQGNARIGANVKASDELTARFEYGASGGNANVRLLYGEWNFGAGKLLIGKDYTPVWHSVSNQVGLGNDLGLGGVGENYSTRAGQIKLTFGDFKIAIVDPNAKYMAGGIAAITTNTEVKMPGIQAKYRLAMDNWYVAVSAAYASFEVGTGLATGTQDVDSYELAGAAGITFGAASIKASVFGGTNVGNITATDVNGGVTGNGYAVYTAATNTLVDNDAFGYALVAAYTINDMFALEAGVGYVETELDMANAVDDDATSYYFQAPITLAPGVFIVPEIGVIDYKQATQDEITYYGAKWQINF